LPSTVEQLNPSRVKLTVEIPFADLQPHLTKAYREIAQSVTIPGFRKGKVPSAVIDQRFGRGMVLQEAINAALPTAYGEAVEANKLIPLGDPDVEITKLEDGDVVEFVAEVDVRPEIDLPEFGTLTATVAVLADLEAEIDNRIETMRERFPPQPTWIAPRPRATWSLSTWSAPVTAKTCRTPPPRGSATRSVPAACWTASTKP